MTKLSGREALLSGFRLVARDPKLILAWGGLYFAVSVLPQLLAYVVFWPDLLAALEAGAKSALVNADGAKVAEVTRFEAKMLPWQMLTVPLSIIGLTALYGAIYRAVLTPLDRRSAYLRLGRAEGAMALSWLASLCLFILAFCAASLVVLILSFAGRAIAGGESGAGGLITFGLLLVAMVLGGWGAIRLSMAPVMSFSEQRFRLMESWSMTRGHGWKIFGIYLALFLTVLVIEIAIILIVLLIVGGIGMGLSHAANVQPLLETFAARLQQNPKAWGPPFAAAYLLFSLVACFIMAAVYACLVAPLASIYRQLTAGPVETV